MPNYVRTVPCPNITGWISTCNAVGSNDDYCGGAFTKTLKAHGKQRDGSWTGNWYQADIAASNVNELYGHSSNVQPAALQVLIIIKI